MKTDLKKLNEKRVLVKDIFESKGKKVLLKGWIYEIRDLAKLKFFLLRDFSGIIQCIIKDKKLMNKISELSLESVVEVEGEVQKANVKAEFVRNDVEVKVSNLKIISKAEKLPIHVNEKTTSTDLSKRLDYRGLDLRKPKIQAIFKIQSTIGSSFKNYFVNKGFIDVHTPSLISASSEGGTDLFEAKYFEKKVYLAQSPQLYKQMLACSIENVVTIAPVWRAEKHNTVRHLNECRQMDIEMAFADAKIVMKEMEDVVKYIVGEVMEKNKAELELLGINLKVPKAKYMTFEEVANLMKKHKVKIGNDDLTGEAERKLDELFKDTIVFVYDWPMNGKPFYIMPKQGQESLRTSPKRGQSKEKKANVELSEGFDAIYKGMEISSGGHRIHIPELLEKRLKVKGLNPKDFKSYVDSFRFGAPPHSGWSIGIERFTQVLLELSNIREAVLFPRDRDRVVP